MGFETGIVDKKQGCCAGQKQATRGGGCMQTEMRLWHLCAPTAGTVSSTVPVYHYCCSPWLLPSAVSTLDAQVIAWIYLFVNWETEVADVLCCVVSVIAE